MCRTMFFHWFKLISFVYAANLVNTLYQKDIFATKTAYSWAYEADLHGHMQENSLFTFNNNITKTHCRSIFALVVIRHGARNPGAETINKMTEIQNRLSQNIEKEDFSFITKWIKKYKVEKEKLLTDLGAFEQYSLGKKFAKYLRSLFEDDLESLKFVVSSKQRTEASGASFHKGITDFFEEKNHFVPLIQDDIMRFHDRCEQYKQLVGNRSNILNEYVKFRKGKLVRNVAKSVSQRLGVATQMITPGDVQLLFDLCAFEMANYNESDWCTALNWNEKKVMEYLSDIKQYLMKAYGHSLIGRMSCPLIKAIFEELDGAVTAYITGKRHSPGTFMFGHAETLAPLYAGLGLFKDYLPLTADNYHLLQNRSFRSSKILPFSSNLAFILYRCQPSEENSMKANTEEFDLRLVLNGEPLNIPVCGKDTCSYKKVRESYSTQVDHCNFDAVCRVKKINSEL